MNYQKHYDALIERARFRNKPEGYCEKHHIIPSCVGGSDDVENLVYLTAKEHFIAHYFLFRIHRYNKLGRAFMLMSDRLGLTSRQYEVAKSLASESMKGDLNPARRPDVKLKMSASQKANPVWLGKKRPDQSERMSGENNPAFGKSNHVYGIVKFSRESKGKTLEEIHGLERGSEIRKSMLIAQKDVYPAWALGIYECHVCNKKIKGSGNVSQHLLSKHGLNYSECKELYSEKM